MMFFLIILFILILFIFVIIASSIIQFSLFVCTRDKVEIQRVIFPGFLSLFLFCFIIYITHIILLKFNIDILNLIYMLWLRLDADFNHIIYSTFAFMGSLIIFSIIQAFFIKLIYFNYSKVLKIFKKSKDNFKNTENSNALSETKVVSISFLNSYLTSILSFSISFFIFILFIFLGMLIGIKFI